MGRKRKSTSNPAESAEPPLKQPQLQPQVLPEEDQTLEDQDNGVEYEEVEVEEDDDEEEVQEAEEEENNAKNQNDDEEEEETNANQQNDEDADDEPIQKLLEPFSKEQILSLLYEAANNHRDVAVRIRKVADEDPAHRKIFVHGLGWDTNAETLISVFKDYGEIEDCKAVTDKASGKSKGYGFILFKSRRGARNALKEPQKKIGNRTAACQLASIGPVQQSPVVPVQVSPVQPMSEYTQRKIFVSNVGADLDPQKLRVFFSKFGEIEEGPLGLDKMTGKPKGFCLFVYKSVESARKALDEPHKEFEGHVLHCQKAIDGPKRGKQQFQQHQNPQRAQFHRNEPSPYGGGAAAVGQGHLMAPAGPGVGFNQQAAAAQALNPALGQALTALLATQGAGLGLTNLLGNLGSATAVNPAVPSAGHGIPGGYGNQPTINSGVIGGYANPSGLQGTYPSQQVGQSGSGRGQHGVGQYGGVAPNMGH